MKLGIMQPYFLPYIGYWQLIKAVDKFVVYDNIQYTKKGWINRNRFLQNGKDEYFTLPLRKDSDFLNVKDRFISSDFDRKKLLNQIKSAYGKAPLFNSVFPLIEVILTFEENNLFKFIHNSMLEICNYLEIKTEFVISSEIPVDHTLKSESKVLAICKALSASQYINPIGGVELYSKEKFVENKIRLNFLQMDKITYKQFKNEFIPCLSILDVMMFNSVEEINRMLDKYELV